MKMRSNLFPIKREIDFSLEIHKQGRMIIADSRG